MALSGVMLKVLLGRGALSMVITAIFVSLEHRGLGDNCLPSELMLIFLKIIHTFRFGLSKVIFKKTLFFSFMERDQKYSKVEV